MKHSCNGRDGQPEDVAGVALDITGQQRTEAALQAAEQRLRNIVEYSTNLFYVHSSNQILTYVSPQSRQFFDCEPEEALVRWTEFITDNPVNRAAIEATKLAIATGERQPPYQVECIGRSGRNIWVEVNEAPVVENGKTVAVVGSLTDITERKRAEEEIKNLNASLAARNAELEDVNRELEAFNYTVAHDLRKPLTVVNGYCQAIRESCSNNLNETCRSYLQEAYDGTWRMNRLIDALLNFSQLTHVEPQRQRVDLSAMAQEVAAELQLVEPERRVTFRIADGVSADGDVTLLRVVLDNLLGNAWKYTALEEKGIIEFGTTEVAGKTVCFVRDNGNGFDMADAGKLFAPFQRLPGGEELRGFGIGLATVERIIKRHGGKVWAEGEPGKGACFYFTLSREKASN